MLSGKAASDFCCENAKLDGELFFSPLKIAQSARWREVKVHVAIAEMAERIDSDARQYRRAYLLCMYEKICQSPWRYGYVMFQLWPIESLIFRLVFS